MNSYHEALGAAGTAALYCADEGVWPQFEAWLREKGALLPGEEVTRESFLRASRALGALICEIETELLIARAGQI